MTVPSTGIVLDELSETYFLELANPTNATIGGNGLGTITDNDPLPALAIGDTTVTEGDSGTVNATVLECARVALRDAFADRERRQRIVVGDRPEPAPADGHIRRVGQAEEVGLVDLVEESPLTATVTVLVVSPAAKLRLPLTAV